MVYCMLDCTINLSAGDVNLTTTHQNDRRRIASKVWTTACVIVPAMGKNNRIIISNVFNLTFIIFSDKGSVEYFVGMA